MLGGSGDLWKTVGQVSSQKLLGAGDHLDSRIADPKVTLTPAGICLTTQVDWVARYVAAGKAAVGMA
jgi:hypothetical protein